MLVVLERATNKVTGSFKLPKNNHVASFRWVNNERLVISVAEKFDIEVESVGGSNGKVDLQA